MLHELEIPTNLLMAVSYLMHASTKSSSWPLHRALPPGQCGCDGGAHTVAPRTPARASSLDASHLCLSPQQHIAITFGPHVEATYWLAPIFPEDFDNNRNASKAVLALSGL